MNTRKNNDLILVKKRKIAAQIQSTACIAENCSLCSLEDHLQDGWKKLLHDELSKEYYKNIKAQLHSFSEFYPPVNQIFNFSNFTKFDDIKVVILGQDPYHNTGQAMGLSFSVPKECKVPPSLVNIYKEIKGNFPEFEMPKHGDLTSWAQQGILLLNDTLTVTKNSPASHSNIGWKIFTTEILKMINEKLNNVVFVLWGNHAKSKKSLLSAEKHLILESGHPSPFSVKLFQGCKHFSKINEYLVENKKEPIDWTL